MSALLPDWPSWVWTSLGIMACWEFGMRFS